MVRRTCTMSWQPRAPVTRRVLAGLCEGDAPWAGVSEAGPALTGGSRTGLGWHWQDNAQLAARPPAERAHSPNCPSCSSARETVGGPGHSKAACVSPGASRLGHVGGLSGYHDARGSSWQVGPCRRCRRSGRQAQGPSLAPRPQRAGRGAHGHSHCGRGHAFPGRCLLARPGHHTRDHEEHE